MTSTGDRSAVRQGGEATICPRCGSRVAPGSVICGLCLQPLEGGGKVADERTASARETARRRERAAARRRRLGWFAATLAVVAVGVYVLWLRPGPPPPAPTSTARSLTPATEAPDRWPSPGGDNAGSRATAASPHIEGREAWRRTVESPLTSEVVAGDRLLYFGISSGALIALSREDGREVWRIPIAGQLDAAPVVAGDRLYIMLRNGTIQALDASDGRELWTGGDGPAYFQSGLVAGGVVYGMSLGQATALDAETGSELWTRRVDQRVSANTAPALLGDALLIASYRRAELLDRHTGEELFFYTLPGPDHLLFGGNQGVLVAPAWSVAFGLDQRRPWWDGLRTAWGQLWLFGMAPAPPPQPRHWVGPAERNTYPPAVGGDTLILAAAGGIVRGLDLRTGEPKWEVKLGPLKAAPVVTAAGVLLAEAEALVLLDTQSGKERSRRAVPGGKLGGFTVTASATYLLSDERTVIALR